MGLFAVFVLTVALVLSALIARLSFSMGWHWGLTLVVALIPLVAVYFLGVFGLVPSAALVSALYRSSGRALTRHQAGDERL